MPDLTRLRALAAAVGEFYIRDRAMSAAQRNFERGLAAGEPDYASVRAYLAAVKRYFRPFHAEAQAQLKHVDRELEKLYQLQFNLTAERGVAARRVELTQGVLRALEETAAL